MFSGNSYGMCLFIYFFLMCVAVHQNVEIVWFCTCVSTWHLLVLQQSSHVVLLHLCMCVHLELWYCQSSHAVSHYALILSHGALQPSRVQFLQGDNWEVLELNWPIWLVALHQLFKFDWSGRFCVVNLILVLLEQGSGRWRVWEDGWMRKGEISLGGLYKLWSLH